MKKAFILLQLILLLLLLPEIRQRCGSHDQVRVVGMEMELSSEESRRWLLLWAAGETKYISYQALRGDVVPCAKPGVPYYNCHAFPSASPYSRGCETISACMVRHHQPLTSSGKGFGRGGRIISMNQGSDLLGLRGR